MIDKKTAEESARAYIASMEFSTKDELVLQEDKTIEKPFGWVFFYNSKKFVETRDFHYALLGNAPLIVDKESGDLHVTGTAKPTEYYIEEYERKRVKDTSVAKK